MIYIFQSTYPPKLSLGQPIRHHIVTYLHVKLKKPHTSASILVNPDPEEVGAATWVDRNFVKAIVKGGFNYGKLYIMRQEKDRRQQCKPRQ